MKAHLLEPLRAIATALRLCAIANALCACTTPGTTLRYAPEQPEIIGVESALAEGPVDVVLVHGMCFKDETWVTSANQALAKALGMTVRKTQPAIPIGEFGGKLYESELDGPGGIVRTYAILWSPAAAHARESLCYDTNAPTPSCPADDKTPHLQDRRALINAQLKNTIMDGCLSEAMYAMGEDGIHVIGSTVEKGLEIALNGGRAVADKRSLSAFNDNNQPLFVVTQSLGSKLFIDAAIRMANRSCEASISVAHAIGRTTQVFMEANQLPILSLAYDPVLIDGCAREKSHLVGPSSGLNALATLHAAGRRDARLEKSAVAMPLKIAAFTDPNDILSYTLVPAPNVPGALEVSDIVLTNDWAWLGLFENPLGAHTTYGDKCRVQQVIAYGTKGLTTPC